MPESTRERNEDDRMSPESVSTESEWQTPTLVALGTVYTLTELNSIVKNDSGSIGS